MTTVLLNTKKTDTFKDILSMNENMTYRKSATQMTPPEGFMTGDEFERRVKERVTKFYKENGLL